MRWLRMGIGFLSFVMLILICIAWVRSEALGEVIGVESRDSHEKVTRIDGVFSGGGQLAFASLQVEHPPMDLTGVWRQMPIDRSFWTWRRDFVPYAFPDTAHGWLRYFGFGRSGTHTGTITRWVFKGVGVPYWLVALAFGAFPGWLGIYNIAHRIRVAERHRLGQCLHCGYDLRATIGRCPECGRDATC